MNVGAGGGGGGGGLLIYLTRKLADMYMYLRIYLYCRKVP